MAQRVDYAVFPNVREDAFIATMNKIFGHVRRSQLSSRDFRDWLKDEGLYSKDDTPHLLSFLDLHTDGVVRLGHWAEKFFAAPDEDQGRDLLYKRLVDENTLLVKYALEALDIEGGGRLHSTYELHRMLTSYVYPGKHVGLVPFQNWIKWIVASGRVKLIGIRWGLTDLGKQAVPRLRTIDVDEYLEDEAAEAKAGAAVPAPAAAPAAAPVPAPVARERAQSDTAAPVPVPVAAPGRATASKAAAEPELDEEALDLPPESEPIDDAVYQKYEDRLAGDVPEAPPAPPVPARGRTRAAAAPVQSATATMPAESQAPVVQPTLPRHATPLPVTLRQAQLEVACSAQPMDVPEIIGALREYGRTRHLGGGSLLLAHGLEARMHANEAARHLFLAALLARLYALKPDGSLAELLVERAGALGPVAVLLDRPEALPEVLVRWSLAQGDPASAAVRAALLDAVLGGRALKAQPDLPTVLAEAASSEVLIGLLGQGLLRAAPVTAQLWLVREMVKAGLWTRPSATEIAFVPTRAVRLMAYRLRLIDSHFAQGAALLLQIARRLCPILPPGSVEAAAFDELALSDHLRFDCHRVPVCQQPCAWAPAHGEAV